MESEEIKEIFRKRGHFCPVKGLRLDLRVRVKVEFTEGEG